MTNRQIILSKHPKAFCRQITPGHFEVCLPTPGAFSTRTRGSAWSVRPARCCWLPESTWGGTDTAPSFSEAQ
jgi:hypothetical protein